ncbi:MAG: tRNA (guanosine(37)-N1)-methyltransferase TrmD [Bacteroidia bacterium]|nr:tRNA (guanosine(37)-N1)-methyltransferase TrmD [Bacteroidia bacterium]MDW8332729.1 tRNA (guanosine(37)-N1)-methyltransferase TrmD [Bacteroidia bacterium]
MRIDVVSCLPRLLQSPLEHSILKRAQEKGLVQIVVHDLRDYTDDKHRTVDDYPYGGAAGMVLKVEPVAKCVRALCALRRYDHVIYTTPDGAVFNQAMANRLSLAENLLIFAGHYKGLDQRARDLFFTDEISIGDYVLSGGELPALVIIDAVVRLIPGVLGDETSALSDSFQDGLLAPPVYTRPAVFEGLAVPPVLLSGNHREIEAWNDAQAYEKTRLRRPDLLNPPATNDKFP